MECACFLLCRPYIYSVVKPLLNMLLNDAKLLGGGAYKADKRGGALTVDYSI